LRDTEICVIYDTMCGIAGIILKPNHAGEARALTARMCDALAHRGPDDAGIFVSPDRRVALGNRRLAIRDLSPLGHMPMILEDGRVALTYNGELYNTEELRAALEREGSVFCSTSDTEVILRGYAAWGEAVFARMRGIFALAVYEARGRVVLARDPMGVKPLYYAHTGEGLVFASELKALRTVDTVSRELDPVSLVAYLELGAVPTPRTIYDKIHALEPGTQLAVDTGTMRVRTTRFWSLPTGERAAGDAVEETRAALADAVRSQLVSDVPLGAFLSGGLDSSAVVALMRQATNGTLRTCSMVFEEAEFSEAPYARAVAEHVDAEHFERVVTAQDVKLELDRILWTMDQPTVDGVNSYFVSQTAREAGLTVALSGLGGDELFGGYPTFYAAPRLEQRLRRISSVPAGRELTRAVLGFLPNPARYVKIQDALEQPASPASAYLVYRGVFAPSQVRALVTPEIWNAAREFDPLEYVAGRAVAQPGAARHASNRYGWTSRAELATYTLNQLLRDTDVMSMAHSLEVRVPLLDPRLVEHVVTLPDAEKQNGLPKSLLLRAVGDLLPPVVRERRVKQGFTFPLARWLRGELKDALPRVNGARGILKPDAAARVTDAFERGRMHWSRAWSLLVLNAWLEQN
jgi:asparagine synthase (glutamine-hydrolysing)